LTPVDAAGTAAAATNATAANTHIGIGWCDATRGASAGAGLSPYRGEIEDSPVVDKDII
jgi:hypothetical protein